MQTPHQWMRKRIDERSQHKSFNYRSTTLRIDFIFGFLIGIGVGLIILFTII